MRICLISHSLKNLIKGDIGTKLVGFYIAKELKKNHELIQIDIKDINLWRKIRNFKPQIIHFVLCPSTLGLLISKITSFFYRSAKIVMSAPNPYLPFKELITFLKPDITLAQSYESEKTFKNLGIKTKFLSNGVDIDKFIPKSDKVKKELRKKYDIDLNSFIILHVGPIIKKRNIRFLKNLQNEHNQVIIIGRVPYEKDVYQYLTKNGCLVWIDHFKNIEEIYALSDCYIFPTPIKNKNASIEIPLSVMEAMSCNLPVITTKFGALPRILEAGDGLFFMEKEEDYFNTLDKIKSGTIKVRTREKVLPYSWENIAKRLEEIYEEIVSN